MIKERDIPYFKCQIPAAKKGNVAIEKFEIAALEGEVLPDNGIPDWARRRPGLYTVLIIDGIRMMTDLYEEWWSQRAMIKQSINRGGNVLVSGLGLGLVIDSVLIPENSRVSSVTVVEKNTHVISLVGKHLSAKYGKRIRILHGDIFDFNPEVHYSVVWHDIWPNPTTISEEEKTILKDKFSSHSDWQGIWDYNCYA